LQLLVVREEHEKVVPDNKVQDVRQGTDGHTSANIVDDSDIVRNTRRTSIFLGRVSVLVQLLYNAIQYDTDMRDTFAWLLPTMNQVLSVSRFAELAGEELMISWPAF
jgi:hypothetical protein